MGQIVYVDILFMINFSMDFLCFFIASKILNTKLSLIRTLLGAVIGGIYANVALFMSAPRMAALLLDIFICVIMCTVAYLKKGRGRTLPLFILVYFAVSMALGGFMTAIFNLLNRADLPSGENDMSDGISVWLFMLLAAISALITLFGGRFFRKKATQRTAEISVTYDGKCTKLTAMSDSGNLLREPISGRPCIVADTASLKYVLPEHIYAAAMEKDIAAISSIREKDARRIRIIPIRTASGESALIALRVDTLTVDCGNGARDVDALVALSNIKKESSDGSCALIPPELMI